MSICIYTYNGFEFGSLEELTKYYYKANFPLTNHNIYSSEEIVDSTLSKLRKKIISRDEAGELNKPQLTHVVSQSNPKIMEQLGLDIERFAPEYNKQNRIIKYIITQLVDEGSNKIELEKQEFNELLKQPEARRHLKEIESIIYAEEETNLIMTYLRKAVALGSVYGGDTSWGKNELRKAVDRAIEDELILEIDAEILETKLIDIYENIVKIIHRHGVPMSDVLLSTEPGVMQEMTGHFDIIVVDSDGHAHVYAIKSSKHEFSDWDSAKRLNTDYQLAFQRALIGQYVPITSTSLNVIPISTGNLKGGKLNPRKLYRGETEVRTADPKAGLQYGTGKLFTIASHLIPYIAKIATNDERRKKILKDVKKLLPSYEIKTSSRKVKKEDTVRQIIKNGFFFDNTDEYAATDEAKKDYIIVKNNKVFLKNNLDYTAEELQKKAEEMADNYIKFLETVTNKNVISLKNAIISAINSGNPKSLSLYNNEQAVQAQKVLVQYLNNNYRVLDSVEELNDLGVIIMQNRRSGDVVAINISGYNTLVRYDENYYYKDAEYFKVFTILNNLHEELHLDINKIQDIIIFDLDGKTYTPGDINHMFEKYKQLADTKSYRSEIKLNESTFLNFEESTEKILEGVFYTYNEVDKREMQNIFKDIEGNISKVSAEELVRVITRFEDHYKDLSDKIFNSSVDFTKPEEYIYALLKTLLLGKYGLVPAGDSTSLRNYAVKIQDFTGIISAMYNNNIPEYNKEGEAILGAIGGLKMVTPDRVPSKDLFNIDQIIASTVGIIRKEVDKYSSRLKTKTRKFYKDVGFKGFQRNVVGDFRTVFKNMWVHSGDKISAEWKVKNPYSTESILKVSEREYLKGLLFDINKHYLHIPDAEVEKINFSTLDTIKNTASEKTAKLILQRVDTGEYFRMPLVRSKSWTRHKKLFTSSKGAKGIMAETKDFVDGRQLQEEDLANIKKDSKQYKKMYEVYGKQREEYIAELITENGSVSYEIDLDTIAHKIIFEKVKKKHVDKVFPVINAYAWWIKLNGGRANKDVSAALEHVKDSIDKSLLDQPIIDPEWGDIVAGAGLARKITTPLMLALRPAIFLKEMSLGLFRGISITMTQFFGKDQFTYKDYFSALKEVFTPDQLASEKFNKVQAINAHYGFANMDLNSYTYKVQTNRWPSLFTGIGPLMYSMNTMPDYFNRLSLFIAKMKHDGSYEAHTQDEHGKMIYDPTKDKRFEYYFKNRDNHKDQFGKYIGATNDEKFNFQRNLYLLVQDEVNMDRKLAGKEEFNETDHIIDDAYSEKERQSYKSFTDSIYGYYDKENSPALHYGAVGIIFMQFMQFWPGKMRTWFGRPTDEHNKVIGKHVQKTEVIDGVEKKLWRKIETNEDGRINITTTTENTGDPLLEWKGLAHEGIFYSMSKTVNITWRSLFQEGKSLQETWGEINKDEMLMRRVMYGLMDGLMIALFFKIFQMMYRAITGVGNPAEDGTMGEEVKQLADSAIRKARLEASLIDNTWGALNMDPAFFSYSVGVLNDVKNLMDGDKTISQFMGNIGAMETLRDWRE